MKAGEASEICINNSLFFLSVTCPIKNERTIYSIFLFPFSYYAIYFSVNTKKCALTLMKAEISF